MTPIRLTVAATIAATTVNGSIYIMPPDIDNYKRKTDQAFYDLYQNDRSAIKANKALDPYTTAINTSQRMFEGETIRTVAQGTVMGSQIPAGMATQVEIDGTLYTVGADINGELFINGKNSNGKTIVRKGNNAKQITRPICTTPSKYGCLVSERGAEESFFDVASGQLTVASVTQTQTAKCGKYGCSTPSFWMTTSLKSVDVRDLKLGEAIKKGIDEGKIVVD